MAETRPLFMRLPPEAADQLERIAQQGGATKREVVTRLILGDGLEVGRHSFHPAEASPVLTSAEAAALLRVDEAAVLELAERGELPARRLGQQWRFSREALLAWLAETTA